MPSPLFVGLDAGGTKTAALASTGAAPRSFSGPGAQVLRDGPEAAAATLAALVDEARAAYEGADLGGIAVGLAGAGRPDAQAAVARGLQARFPGASITVTHDAEIALHAAWGAESGALLLVGTGSLVYARTREGAPLRAGGWGALLGDDGSGTALGRAALRAVLAAFDGGPPTALQDRAAEEHGLHTADDVIRAVYTERRPLAGFAPLLLGAAAAEDWVASSVLARQTNALAQQAGWMATRAGDDVAHRIAYAGGLVNEEVYCTALDAALARHLPGWSVGRCEAEPVAGALAMARDRAAELAYPMEPGG